MEASFDQGLEFPRFFASGDRMGRLFMDVDQATGYLSKARDRHQTSYLMDSNQIK